MTPVDAPTRRQLPMKPAVTEHDETLARGAAVLDLRINQYPVNWAIYLSSAIHGRDHAPAGSVRSECGALVLSEFTAAIGSFPPQSGERAYLTRLLMIALDLAAGIRTKKEIRATCLEDALKNRELHYQRLVNAERWQGVLRLGFKLVILSGFGFVVAKAFLSTTTMDAPNAPHPGWASAAFGLGFALLATYIRSWAIDRKISRLFRDHDRDAHAAQREYQRTVRREYQWASEEAADAWTCLTGSKPNFQTAALLSLLAPDDDTVETR